jgi:2-polyprenyl-3-methyl-5-hydroxy-6-metoxy-1,4-benzoquinol methylase
LLLNGQIVYLNGKGEQFIDLLYRRVFERKLRRDTPMKSDETRLFVPEITKESIMTLMREAIDHNQQETVFSDTQAFDSSGIRAEITTAEGRANVGTQVTPMAQIPAPLRKLARLTGRIVIRLASFITVEQRSFNMHVLTALRLLTEAVERSAHNQVAGFRRQADSNAAVNEKLSRQQEAIANLAAGQQKAVNDLNYLKTSLVLLERRLSMLLEEAGKRLPGPFDQEQFQKIAAEGQNGLDAFYVAFEDRFRGPQEQIMERLQFYLPYVRRAADQTGEPMVLDIGCGRGEWLELLYREGIPARGVDANRLMIAQCRERCLEVVNEDALAYLRSLPDAGIGVVTGFHVIEHLPFEALIKLMDEALRVLKPGGMVIFETPNPQNVLVGSCSFYLDPTHHRPLPSQTMKLLSESRGFVDVKILELHPSTATPIAEETDVSERFNEYFYGAMDYAVIGRKG